METLIDSSAATPGQMLSCRSCGGLLGLDYLADRTCQNCSLFKDDLTLDLTDATNSLSMLHLNQQFSSSSSNSSPLNLSPELFSTKPAEGSDCPLHHSACLYWCYRCMVPICVICVSQHHTPSAGHKTGPCSEAQNLLLSQLHSEMQAVRKLHSDTRLLGSSQREFLLKVLESCAKMEMLMKEELESLDHPNSANGGGMSDEDTTQYLLNKISFQLGGLSGPEEAAELLSSLHAERVRLQTKQQQLAMQLTLNRVIGSSNQVLELHTFRQAVQSLRHSARNLTSSDLLHISPSYTDPVALLANVCNARLYTKQLLASSLLTSKTSPTLNVLSPTLHSNFPRFFLDIEVDGIVEGRVILETRPDVAPKMSKNFASLANGEKGFGYKGCQVFQCWGGESCIAGDFECNSGRGGRSIFAEEPFFMPDDSKLPCVRAAVGMRRTQKKHHSQGLVGSQFRILLRDMPFFTGVFGHIIHGLELIERVSFLGDHQGFPRKLITIANCGQIC